jgi:predicted SnoaL-like aldol condensation-catalyzing enzyme
MSKKEMATKFLKMASSGDVSEAYDRYIHESFLHHYAYFKGDGQTLMTAIEEDVREFPEKHYEMLRSLEEDDLVAVHGKATNVHAKTWSVVHILRFEGEKII